MARPTPVSTQALDNIQAKLVEYVKTDLELPDDVPLRWSETFVPLKMELHALEESTKTDQHFALKLVKSLRSISDKSIELEQQETKFAGHMETFSEAQMSSNGESAVGFAMSKFSDMIKDLTLQHQEMNKKKSNIMLHPLELSTKKDYQQLLDSRSSFEKTVKHFEGFKAKHEKRPLGERNVAEAELRKETLAVESCTCEYLMRLREHHAKKEIDLAHHLTEYYCAFLEYFKQGYDTLCNMSAYIEALQEDVKTAQNIHNSTCQELLSTVAHIQATTGMDKIDIRSDIAKAIPGNSPHETKRMGYLKKHADRKGLRNWQKRWCVVNETTFTMAKALDTPPTVSIPLAICTVREANEGKSSFILVTPERSYLLQADNEGDKHIWVSVILSTINEWFGKEGASLTEAQSYTTVPLPAPEEGDESLYAMYNQSFLEHSQSLPGNSRCADCDAADPEWASQNFGVFICDRCSEAHASLGSDYSILISCVDSVVSEADLILTKAIGNELANSVLESKIPMQNNIVKPTAETNDCSRLSYITSKYKNFDFVDIASIVETDEGLIDEAVKGIIMRDCTRLLELKALGVDFHSFMPGCNNGDTLLHFAAGSGSIVAVAFMCLNGSYVNTTNSLNRSAIHEASAAGELSCVKVLLHSGIEWNVPDSDGFTPLELADYFQHSAIVDVLQAFSNNNFSVCHTLHIKHWGRRHSSNVSLRRGSTSSSETNTSTVPTSKIISTKLDTLNTVEEMSSRGSTIIDGIAPCSYVERQEPVARPRVINNKPESTTIEKVDSAGHTFTKDVDSVVERKNHLTSFKRSFFHGQSIPSHSKPMTTPRTRPMSLQSTTKPKLSPKPLVTATAQTRPQPLKRNLSLQAETAISPVIRPKPKELITKSRLDKSSRAHSVAGHRLTTAGVRDDTFSKPSQGHPLTQLNLEQKGQEVVIAAFDCYGNDESELTFKKGDRIYVETKNDSGWWVGKLHRSSKNGFFPSNCEYQTLHLSRV